MLVSRNPKFVFIEIPRTASRSMCKYLSRISKSSTQYKHHKHTKPPEYSDFFCFATVRNPYARMYSHYLYRKTVRKNNMHGTIKQYNWSFADYVQWATDPKAHPVIHHDMPQMRYLERNSPDMVLRFEQLPDDFYKLPFINRETMGDLPKINHAVGSGGDKWKKAFTAELAELVAEWAVDDFKEFGYDVDSWRK